MTACRQRQAGVTLIELLVVLVILGVVTASIGLSVRSGDGSASIDREIRLLSARFEQAADRVLVRGEPSAFTWTETSYQFLEFDGSDWIPHAFAVLGQSHDLARGVTFAGLATQRHYIIRPGLVNADGPLGLTLASREARRMLIFDGFSLREAGT
ncbi:MAG: prepilin-type N-terminal cleavage/methylation domain-containing protein [Pseudomonadota bacterium]